MLKKEKGVSKYINTDFHENYLTFLPIIALVAGSFFSASLQRARNDLRIIGLNLRNSTHAGARAGVMYYKVEADENLETLSKKFDVSQESIIWANDQIPELITENAIIRIPPVTGVIHVVQRNDTIESVAAQYGVKPDVILNYQYNQFSDDPAFPIYQGQILIVPGGRK
jgi:LysM repeat protein